MPAVQNVPVQSEMSFDLHPDAIVKVEGKERQRVAAFMAAQFARHFNATIEDDTEEVYAIYGADGELEAAFGLNRDPAEFFSRYYVEDLQAQLRSLFVPDADVPIEKLRVAEFAHLCVRNARALCRLVPLLARFLAKSADYLVCTATRELGRYFVRKGLAPNILSRACMTALPPAKRLGWGTYYLHEPMVLCGSLQLAAARLNTAYPPEACATGPLSEGMQHVA